MSRIRLMHSPSFLSRESNIHFYEKTLEKNVKNNESASFKKFSKSFFGVFDTDVAFSAYCVNEENDLINNFADRFK